MSFHYENRVGYFLPLLNTTNNTSGIERPAIGSIISHIQPNDICSYDFLVCGTKEIVDPNDNEGFTNTDNKTVTGIFKIDQNGSTYSRQNFNANGADYAEFFESIDGNQYPLGSTVVLEGDKIRISTLEDDPSNIIGVVRPKTGFKMPITVGNVYWSEWKEKYLCDEFGVPYLEEYKYITWDDNGIKRKYPQDAVPYDLKPSGSIVYETHDENGNPYLRPVKNPNYDVNRPYISREKRDEWNLIGLLGQVPILKDQILNPKWIVMKSLETTNLVLIR